MKLLLGLLSLSATTAFAAGQPETCSSSFIVRPYNVCAHPSNGPDRTFRGVYIKNEHRESDPQGPRANQISVCEVVANKFNQSNPNKFNPEAPHVIQIAELDQKTPTSERVVTIGVERKRVYTCELAIYSYPIKREASKACEFLSPPLYVKFPVNRTYLAQNAELSCLTCDSKMNKNPAELVACLRANLLLVEAHRFTLELDRDDRRALRERINLVLEMNRNRPISGLQTAEELRPFLQFR